ncbi:ATP-binding protein [Xanthobacter sp. VNH20]|uniref:ATP-binding protein n=1 Tax=Xanthobacter sp. VNH20 TaxID=3156616 RepID=UPI0032B3836D
MAITGVSELAFKSILNSNLTPSDSVKTKDRLYGRDKQLKSIDRAMNSSGRQIFIFGDRGVGKTSVARTAGSIHCNASAEPIYVVCGKASGFSHIIQSIGSSIIDIRSRLEKPGTGPSGGLGAFGFTANFSKGTPATPNIPLPVTINDALDVMRYVCDKSEHQPVVIIDEMERISSAQDRESFAEFIKNIPELGDRLKFIFCGISADIAELLNSHPSAGRILEPVHLETIHHSDLWRIITTVSEKIGVEISPEALIRISQISDGFPHFVHLIGESLFWSIYDDPEIITKSNDTHYKIAIKQAIERTEAILRTQYSKATEKTKNTEDYKEVLWALADTTSDKRQLSEIYESSYRRIMLRRSDRKSLSKEALNHRLLALRKEGHGRIVVGSGAGWYAFRENIMRGYVRLRAEVEGVELGRGARISP